MGVTINKNLFGGAPWTLVSYRLLGANARAQQWIKGKSSVYHFIRDVCNEKRQCLKNG